MFVFDRETMVAAEGKAAKAGISYERLMENAGTAAARFIRENEPVTDKKVTVVCGKGNNGGDGFVIARKLYENGAVVAVVLSEGAPSAGLPYEMRSRMPDDIQTVAASHFPEIAERLISDSDILVDALFGFGFKGEAKGTDERLIKALNRAHGRVYSIDLPSGLSSDTGSITSVAVTADFTLTFEAMKPCHILPPANELCGKTAVLKIGIEESILSSMTPLCRVIEKPCLPPRRKISHKGDFGKGLMICGSYGMPGAAILAGKSALRSGIGLLKAVCPPENYTAMAVSCPEAVQITATAGKDNGKILCEAENADAILIGCGLGVSYDKKELVRELVLTTQKPIIVDADGINCICHDIEFIKKVKASVILTPHVGEMARLTGLTAAEIEKDRLGTALRFATENKVYLCLKGANTIVATPKGELFVNVNGNAGMATAGSGDMLAGIILALLCQDLSPAEALTGAVWLHGAAGDAVKSDKGMAGMLPSDMIEKLPYLL